MQIVINIPEELYEVNNRGLEGKKLFDLRSVIWDLRTAVKNGTPLPKGHGKLIDANELRHEITDHKYSISFCEEHHIDQSINLGILNILLSDAPTIIESEE